MFRSSTWGDFAVPTFQGARSLEVPTSYNVLAFEKFTEFPIEIRQLIYEKTLPEPRIIRFDCRQFCDIGSTVVEIVLVDGQQYVKRPSNAVEVSKAKSKASPVKPAETPPKPSSNATNLPWALLAVSKETREYARHKYHFSFAGMLPEGNVGGVYIDFERDTLLFTNSMSLEAMCGVYDSIPFLRSIPRIDVFGTTNPDSDRAISLREFLSKTRYLAIPIIFSQGLIEPLQRFSNLKQVNLQESSLSKELRGMSNAPFQVVTRSGPWFTEWKALRDGGDAGKEASTDNSVMEGVEKDSEGNIVGDWKSMEGLPKVTTWHWEEFKKRFWN